MTPQILGLHVSGAIFWLVAALHLLRLIFGLEIVVAGYPLPLWPSALAAIVFGTLGAWIMKLAHPKLE